MRCYAVVCDIVRFAPRPPLLRRKPTGGGRMRERQSGREFFCESRRF